MLCENVLKTTAVSLILLMGTAQAQITITRADIPSHVNDTFLYKRNNGVATVNVGSAGGPKTWTFDTSTFIGWVKYQAVVDKNTTPFGSLFPTANVTYATQGDTSWLNAYTFFLVSASEFDCLGMGLQFTDTLQHDIYQPAEQAAPLPMTYGLAWHCSYGYSETIPPMVITAEAREWYRVDAWGTVTTPVGTDSCLRVNLVDTVITTELDSGVPMYADSMWHRFYIWHVPLLDIVVSARSPDRDTSLVFTSSDCYRVMVQVRAGVEEQTPPTASNAAPGATLARGTLRLPQSVFQNPQSEMALLDLSGRTVLRIPRSSSATRHSVDVPGLAPGVYFLRQTLPDRQAVVQKYVLAE